MGAKMPMESLLQHGIRKPEKVMVEAWPPSRPPSAPHCAVLTPTREIQSREVGGVRTGDPTKDTKYSTASHCPLEHLFLREKIRRHIIVGKSNSCILYRHRFSVYYLL